MLPRGFLFPQLALLLKSLSPLESLFLDSFFVHAHVVLMGHLPLSLNLDLSLALLLFPDADLLLTLPLFDHLDLLDSGFFSLPLVFLDDLSLAILDESILAMLFGDLFLILTLDQFLVVNPPDPFFLNSLLLEGLFLNLLPLLFLLANGLLSRSRFDVCDVADANSFFFHLPHTLFVLFALCDDSLLVDLPSPLLFFDLAVVLFCSFTTVFLLGFIVVVLNVIPSGFPPFEIFIAPVLIVVRLLIILFLLFILVFLALSGGVDNRLAVSSPIRPCFAALLILDRLLCFFFIDFTGLIFVGETRITTDHLLCLWLRLGISGRFTTRHGCGVSRRSRIAV